MCLLTFLKQKVLSPNLCLATQGNNTIGSQELLEVDLFTCKMRQMCLVLISFTLTPASVQVTDPAAAPILDLCTQISKVCFPEVTHIVLKCNL